MQRSSGAVCSTWYPASPPFVGCQCYRVPLVQQHVSSPLPIVLYSTTLVTCHQTGNNYNTRMTARLQHASEVIYIRPAWPPQRPGTTKGSRSREGGSKHHSQEECRERAACARLCAKPYAGKRGWTASCCNRQQLQFAQVLRQIRMGNGCQIHTGSKPFGAIPIGRQKPGHHLFTFEQPAGQSQSRMQQLHRPAHPA